MKKEDSKEPFKFNKASSPFEPNIGVAALDGAKAEHARNEKAEAESRQLSKGQSQASITSAEAKEVATEQLAEQRAEGQEHWSQEEWEASEKYWHTDEQKYQPALARFFKNDPVRMLYTENEVMRTSKDEASGIIKWNNMVETGIIRSTECPISWWIVVSAFNERNISYNDEYANIVK